jgi:hypothetical protein
MSSGCQGQIDPTLFSDESFTPIDKKWAEFEWADGKFLKGLFDGIY